MIQEKMYGFKKKTFFIRIIWFGVDFWLLGSLGGGKVNWRTDDRPGGMPGAIEYYKN